MALCVWTEKQNDREQMEATEHTVATVCDDHTQFRTRSARETNL